MKDEDLLQNLAGHYFGGIPFISLVKEMIGPFFFILIMLPLFEVEELSLPIAVFGAHGPGDLYNSAKEMAGFIPLGQPILVGHHSEKRDRNYREKVHNKFGKSFEKREKAEYYAAQRK